MCPLLIAKNILKYRSSFKFKVHSTNFRQFHTKLAKSGTRSHLFQIRTHFIEIGERVGLLRIVRKKNGSERFEFSKCKNREAQTHVLTSPPGKNGPDSTAFVWNGDLDLNAVIDSIRTRFFC